MIATLGLPTRASGFPQRITWSGTVTTTEGFTGTLTAKTHFILSHVDGPSEWFGHFRCRGAGCPWPRGRADFQADGLGVDVAYLHGGTATTDLITCVYSISQPLPGFLVDGPYTCWVSTPPFPAPTPHVISTGTMTLMAVVR